MTIYDVTMLCIETENTIAELDALSERIDVMFLVGGKFEMDEYLKLSDAVSKKISDMKSLESSSEETPEIVSEPQTT